MSDVMQLVNKKIDLEFSTYSEVPSDFMPSLKPYSRAARYALLKLMNDTSLQSVKITNHTHLENRPDVLVSLSHTKDMTVAARAYFGDFKSIGVDIEDSKRIVKPGIEKFFINEFDQSLDQNKSLKDNISYLKTWCAKEAIFKAISPLYKDKNKKVLVLKDIILRSDQSFECFDFRGHFSLSLKEINSKTYIIAIAALDN